MNRFNVNVWLFLLIGCIGLSEAGLVSYWKLDKIEDGVIFDSSGNGLHGKVTGKPQVQQDSEKGDCISFDGIDDYIQIGDEHKFDIVGSMTISAWFKIDEFRGSWPTLISKGDHTWRISGLGGERRLHVAMTPSVGSAGVEELQQGRWYHMITVYNDSVPDLYTYLDNNLEFVTGSGNTIDTDNNEVWIGSNAEFPDRFWNGFIRDLAIFDYALSEEESTVLRHCGPVEAHEYHKRTDEIRKTVETLPKEKITQYLEQQISSSEGACKANCSASLFEQFVQAELYRMLADARSAGDAFDEEILQLEKKRIDLVLPYAIRPVSLLTAFCSRAGQEGCRQTCRNYFADSDLSAARIEEFAGKLQAEKNWELFCILTDSICDAPEVNGEKVLAAGRGLSGNKEWEKNYIEYLKGKSGAEKVLVEYCRHLSRKRVEVGEYEDALPIYQIALEHCQKDKMASLEFEICKCLYKAEKYAETISLLDKFNGNNDSSYREYGRQAMLMQGRANLQLGQFEKAIDEFLLFTSQFPEDENSAEANFFIGYCNMLKGDYAAAKEGMKIVIQDYPDSTFASRAKLTLERMENMEQ